MEFTTPFLNCFGSLLFGKPAAPELKKAFANLSECNSLEQLRRLFGCYIPMALLASKDSGVFSRRRIYSLEVVFWAFLDQVQTPMSSCRKAVRKVMAYARSKSPGSKSGEISSDTSSYCTARALLPLDLFDRIKAHLIELMCMNIPQQGLWHGRHVKLVDGTGVSMPDTPANQECWPQSASQKPGCGFPMMNLVGIFCLVTGALLDVATGNHHAHETLLFQSLWHTLKKGDLLVADRGYCSFGAVANLLARGTDALMRVPLKRIHKALGAKLPNTESFDVLVTWERPLQCLPSMTAEEFARLPARIPVRVIRYTIAQAGFRTRSVTLVTTVLDGKIKDTEFASLYFRRWGIELHFREIKTFLRMDVLRCLTPHMIERELRMHFIAYNLIRCVMQQSAITHDVDLERVSFKGCMDTVREFSNAMQGFEDKPRTVKALVAEMLWAIAHDLNPKRPGRSEPRAKKRRPKSYKFLTKPRRETGNLPHHNKGARKEPKSS